TGGGDRVSTAGLDQNGHFQVGREVAAADAAGGAGDPALEPGTALGARDVEIGIGDADRDPLRGDENVGGGGRGRHGGRKGSGHAGGCGEGNGTHRHLIHSCSA